MMTTRVSPQIRMPAAKTALKALAFALMLSAATACASPEQKIERYTKSGYDYIEKGNPGKANVQFLNALKIKEDHVPALLGVAQLAENKQDFQTLFGILQQVIRLDPKNVEAQVKIGKLYLIGSEEADAMKAADAALAVDPSSLDAIALKAAVFLKLDDKTQAVELARQVLAKDAKNPEAVAVIASERLAANDPDSALKEVDRALKLDEKVPVLHLLRMQILSVQGKTDDILASFRRLIAIYPDAVAYRQLYARQLVDGKKLKEARAELVKIAQLSPGKIDPVLDVIRIDNAIGGKAAAAKTFKSYVEADPKNIELKFSYGAFLRQTEQFAESSALFEELAKNKDEGIAARAQNEIAAQRLVEGKIEEGRALIDSILVKDPRNTDALIKRAGLKIDDRQFDEAVNDLRAALVDKPDSTPAKLLMATAFERKGDLEFAKSEMAKAVDESKFDPAAANLFAKLLVRTNEAARAKEVLETSLKNFPGSVDNLKLLAATQLVLQDWNGAAATAKQIEAAAGADPTVTRILGAAYAGLNDFSGVIDQLGAENARQPLSGRPLATLVEAYIKDNRGAEAEQLLRGMIGKNPKSYDPRVLLAQILDQQKRYDEIESLLREAYAADKARPEAVENLYRVLRRENREAEILPTLDAIIAESSENFGARYMKADFLISTGQKEAAIAVYGDILERRPGDLIASNNYASLITEVRNDQASLARALEIAKPLADSQNPFFLDTLGWAQFRNGDLAGAQKTLENAVSLVEGFAEGHYHLGSVYLAAGDKLRGEAELKKALAASPTPEVAAKARDLLAKK